MPEEPMTALEIKSATARLIIERRNYYTFKRSCTNWSTFASARKIRDESNLTYEEAQRRCATLNAELTPAQKRRGTRYEFTSE